MNKEAPLLDMPQYLRVKHAVNNTFQVREDGRLVVDDPYAVGELIFAAERRTLLVEDGQTSEMYSESTKLKNLSTPTDLPPSQYQEAIDVFKGLQGTGVEQGDLDQLLTALDLRRKTARETAQEFPPREPQEVILTETGSNVRQPDTPQPLEHRRAILLTMGSFTTFTETAAIAADAAGNQGFALVLGALGGLVPAAAFRVLGVNPFRRNKQKGKKD